jgi:hypothetical protein
VETFTVLGKENMPEKEYESGDILYEVRPV